MENKNTEDPIKKLVKDTIQTPPYDKDLEFNIMEKISQVEVPETASINYKKWGNWGFGFSAFLLSIFTIFILWSSFSNQLISETRTDPDFLMVTLFSIIGLGVLFIQIEFKKGINNLSTKTES